MYKWNWISNFLMVSVNKKTLLPYHPSSSQKKKSNFSKPSFSYDESTKFESTTHHYNPWAKFPSCTKGAILDKPCELK